MQPVRAETDWAVVGAGAAVGAVSGAAVGTLVADGPGAVVGAVVGGAWGAIAGWLAQDQGNAAFLQAKETYARQLANITENYIGLASTSADNYINNYDAQTYFFARKAEWAALQLYNSQAENETSFTYDPYYVLSASDVANGTMATSWAIGAQYEAILNQYHNLASSFVGTYDGMSWGYKSGTEALTSTIDTKSDRIVSVGYMVSENANAVGNYITLSAGSPLYIISNVNSDWAFTITIKNRAGEEVYSFNGTMPAYSIFNWTAPISGDYDIITSGNNNQLKFFGLMSKPISGAATITPAIITFYKDGNKAAIDNSYSLDVDSIWFYQNSGMAADYIVSLDEIGTKMAAVLTKVTAMQVTANNLAQAYYNTLVSEGGGENRIMPDIIFPDPAALENMTAEQIYALYLAYLTQQQEWFKDYSVQDPSSVNISQESLHLKVRGSIYAANGTLLYGNTTIFTPYVSLDDMHLVLGRNNMTQPGFAMIWGSASSLADLDRLSNLKYVALAAGDYFVIEEMALDNEPVTTADLTVTTVEYIVYDEFDPITPPQGATDAEWLLAHWYWFAIIAGAIFCVAWLATRNNILGIVGIILIAVGGAFWILSDAGSATGLLSGLFSIRRGGP